MVRAFFAEPVWDPPSALFSGYWRSFLEIKRLGLEVSPSPPSSSAVKNVSTPPVCGRRKLYLLYKRLEELRPVIHPYIPCQSTHSPFSNPSNHRPCCVHWTSRNAVRKTQERTGLLQAYEATQEILLDLRGASRSVHCSRQCHHIHSSSLNFTTFHYSCLSNAVCTPPLSGHQTKAHQ